MTKSMTALYAFVAFVLGVLVALGAQHFLFKSKDQRDAMETVGAFEGWRLNCPPRTMKTGVCIMQQALGRRDSNAVVAELNIVPKDKTDMLTVVAPLGVFVVPGIKINVGSNEKTVPFKTCLPGGCVATLPVDSDMATALSQNTGLVVTVMTTDGKSVPLSFSLQGYREALAARAVDMAARN
jgi:invasion protein IalB